MVGRLRAGIGFVKRAWALAAPYWRSEDRWRARLMLATIVILVLAGVFLRVLYNDWQRSFGEMIQNKDVTAFAPILVRFSVIAGLFILVAVYRIYLTLMLQMRWRIWSTRHVLDRWLGDRVYYHLELGERRTDNPDQRIADDLRQFAFDTLDLGMGILSSAVTLGSFVAILWSISGPLPLSAGPLSLEIPGYMVWVAVLYAVFGSVATHLVGRRLIPLNFQEQRVEADLRFGLIRIRENAEGVALYRGEGVEMGVLQTRLERIRANWWQIMRFTRNLTYLTAGYDQLAGIFPLLVAAPRYFSGAITLGVLSQIGNAFMQVQGSLSWFIVSYGSIASWKATVDRLLTFQDAMDQASRHTAGLPGIEIVSNGTAAIHTEHLDLGLPDGRTILSDTSLSIEPGERILINGPTGVGKSTLFRALAGIWPFGKGSVHVPKNAHVLFLPQRPYLPITSLREATTYPAATGAFDDASIREALTATGLGSLIGRLDDVENWSLQLSGGEQQRLAVARALLQRPDWLFLDEATAALSEAAEHDMYTLLTERLPTSAIVSIGHHDSLASFHQKRVDLVADANLGVAPDDRLPTQAAE